MTELQQQLGLLDSLRPVSPWRTVCAACRSEGPPSERISEAVALAEDAGWKVVEIRGQRVTLCSACVETAREWHDAPAIIWDPEVQP